MSKVKSNVGKWKQKIQSKLGIEELPEELRLPDGSLPDIKGVKLPDTDLSSFNLPHMPELEVPGLDSNLSPELSALNKDVSLDKFGQLGGLQDQLGKVGEVSSTVSSFTSDPAAALEQSVSNIKEVNVVTDQLQQAEALSNAEVIQKVQSFNNTDALKQEAKEQVVKQAVNHFEGKEEALKSAMEKMSKYKVKYSSLNSFEDIKNIRKNAMHGKPFRERFIPGIEKGRIKYMISPKGSSLLRSNGWSFSAVKDHLVHQFVYDSRGRLVEKKIPGKDWDYFVYDKLNRLVLTQEGHLRTQSKWNFMRYDVRGRIVMAGVYTNATSTTRAAIQTLVDGLYQSGNVTYPTDSWFETRGTALHGYSNTSFPKLNADGTALQVTAVSYYDNYDFNNDGTADYAYTAQGLPNETAALTNTGGLLKGTKKLVLWTSTWLYDYIFYDAQKRPIQVRSNNQLNANIDNLRTQVYDFEGKLWSSKTLHRGGAGKENELTYSLDYRPNGSLKTVSGPSMTAAPIQWSSFRKTTLDGTILRRDNSAVAWDADAFSTNSLAAGADGWVEFRMGETTTNKMLGFSATNANASYTSINFAIYGTAAGELYVYENGTSRGKLGTYTANDFLSVERKKGKIYYKKNNTVFYTSSLTSTTVLYVDCSIYSGGGSLRDAILYKPSQVVIASYDFNDLGQLVDKKLYSVDGQTFKQSIDFRYNILGQLESINNPMLSQDASNDDSNVEFPDFFGMEFLYEKTQSGLSSTPSYDGKISAVKWKSIGSASGAADQLSLTYLYDKSDKVKSTTYVRHSGTAWDADANLINESFTHDQNGNIRKLTRNKWVNQLQIVSGVPKAIPTPTPIDDLTYIYGSGDQLTQVDDATSNSYGFADGTAGAVDFQYDYNGRVTKDGNKKISTVTYNYQGKPVTINWEDGTKIEYTYDGVGTKLSTATYAAGATTPALTTNYVNGFVYENGNLKYFGSPEGRVVMKGSMYEYQLAIVDHQGNTRILFTAENPSATPETATFDGTQADSKSKFAYDATRIKNWPNANQTPGGSYVYMVDKGSKVTLQRSISVYPGDKIDIQAGAYYELTTGYGSTSPLNFIATVASAFGGSPTGGAESQAIYNGVNMALGAFPPGGNKGNDAPSAYLNYILFDKEYHVLNAGWKPANAGTNVKQVLSFPTLQIKQPGYVFMWVSYESEDGTAPVYFDDLKVTHTKSNVIQYNEYYAYGLQTSSSWTREGAAGNDFLYNEGSQLNAATGWYDLAFRNYDPAIGRFMQVDPLAEMSRTASPFAYAACNPIVLNDPLGLLESWDEFWTIVDNLSDQAGSSGGAGWSETGGYTGHYDVTVQGDQYHFSVRHYVVGNVPTDQPSMPALMNEVAFWDEIIYSGSLENEKQGTDILDDLFGLFPGERDGGVEVLVSAGSNIQLGLKRGWAFTFNPLSKVLYQYKGTNKGTSIYVDSRNDGNTRLHSELGISWKTLGASWKRIVDTGDELGFLDGTYQSDNSEVAINAFFISVKINYGTDGVSLFVGPEVGAGLGVGAIGASVEAWDGNSYTFTRENIYSY